MDTQKRFLDQKLTSMDFMDEILVVCPKCSGCASVKPLPGEKVSFRSPRRMCCPSCGLTKDKPPRKVPLKNGAALVESFFERPLWLVAARGDKTIWAYNRKHLDYIADFVGAVHRERNLEAPGCLNCSIISRLPALIKKGSNRKQVLNLIQRMRESLDGRS